MKFRIEQIETDLAGVIHATDLSFWIRLTKSLRATLKIEQNNQELMIIVPEGFTTNGASVPRWFWWVPGFCPLARSLIGASIHDYLYDKACLGIVYVFDIEDATIPGALKVRPLTRAESDQVLRLAMQADGENWMVRWLYWLCVRLFARSHFRR
jgi:hypothetical protein